MPRGFAHVRVSGYLLSMASACLLAVPALRGTHGDPLMLAFVASGVGLSLSGIALRWHSHRMEQRGRGGE
jgi:hypothetical protein